MSNPLFNNTADFEDCFRRQLLHLLELPLNADAPGLFILVMANLSLLPELAESLGPALQARYRDIRNHLGEREDDIAPDDLAVFCKLERFNPARPPIAAQRMAGPWQLQYNPMRSLRPARNSVATIQRLHQPFDEGAFHFDKPFLAREILWRGDTDGGELRLLFNKFPFARYHCLALFDASEHRPQYLSAKDLQQLLRVMDRLSSLEGLSFAWNSLGAQASVNHQHWQMTLRERPYAIESPLWRHNGGDRTYPLEVETFSGAETLWSAIDACQQQNRAFNLYLRPGRYWLIHRRLQGGYEVPKWAGGLAWSEVCGSFSLGDETAFRGLDAEQIESILASLKES